MGDQLDELGEEDPKGKPEVDIEPSGGGVWRKTKRVGVHGAVERPSQETVHRKGRGLKLRKVDGIESPKVSVEPIGLLGHNNEVSAPVTTGPASALVQELEGVLLSGLDGTQTVEVQRDLPAIGIDVARQSLVVVNHELATHEVVVLEVKEEVRGLEDLGADSLSTARERGDATVEVVGSTSVKVTTLEIRDTEKVPHGGARLAASTLTGASTANTGVLKASKKAPKEAGVLPVDIVVGKDSNGSIDVF